MYSTLLPPRGHLLECQRLKGHDPGWVAQRVELHGQELDQEQLPMEEERGSLLRGRLPMR